MTLRTNHDVAIMSVFNLQNIACERICSHRLNEIEPCSLEGDGVLSPVFGYKEVKEVVDLCSSHFIS